MASYGPWYFHSASYRVERRIVLDEWRVMANCGTQQEALQVVRDHKQEVKDTIISPCNYRIIDTATGREVWSN